MNIDVMMTIESDRHPICSSCAMSRSRSSGRLSCWTVCTVRSVSSPTYVSAPSTFERMRSRMPSSPAVVSSVIVVIGEREVYRSIVSEYPAQQSSDGVLFLLTLLLGAPLCVDHVRRRHRDLLHLRLVRQERRVFAAAGVNRTDRFRFRAGDEHFRSRLRTIRGGEHAGFGIDLALGG